MQQDAVSINGKVILIVDDEPDLREAIAYDFKRRGCIVHLAGSGNEALELVNTIKFDAVVSDVRMPNGTGIELLEKIRKIHPTLPIVLLVTGFADITEPEAIDKGAIGRIEKPIDRKKMMELISKALV